MFWLFMELSTLILIFKILKNLNMGSSIYFLMSGLSSIIFLFFLIFSNPNFFTVFILIKFPMFPFFSWLFMSIQNVDFKVMNLILLIQKIPILFLLTLNNLIGLELIIFMNMISCFFMSFNALSLVNSLIVNSIFSSNWIILSSMISSTAMIMYFFLFSLDYMLMMMIVQKSKNTTISKSLNYSIPIIIFSMMSIPPSPNFFMKIILLNETSSISFIFPIILLLVSNFFIQVMLMKHFVKCLNFNKSKPNLMKKLLFIYFTICMLII